MVQALSIIKFLIILMYTVDLTESRCVQGQEVYDVGETWQPAAFFTCVNCTCIINSKGEAEPKCINVESECPEPKCDKSKRKRDPNICCPYCEDIPNIPPTVTTDDEKSSSTTRAPCATPDGRIYQDGDRFPSNATGLKPNSDKQCVMCVCENGKQLCHLKTCHMPKSCTLLVFKDTDCCPVCADCVDQGKKNGSTWHPSIENIGEVTCITCMCMNGKIDCKTICVPDHELPCPHPKKPNGECCKSCPPDDHSTPSRPCKKNKKGKCKRKKNNNNDKTRRKDGKGKRKRKCKGKNKDKKRCRRRKKDRTAKPPTQPAALSAITTPGIDLDTLCLKKRTKYLVYKSIDLGEMFIAFDDIEAATVDVYKWTISKVAGKKRDDLVTYVGDETVSAPDFRRTINSTNVIGTTGKKQYKKFKNRLKKKLKRCNSACVPEMFINILQRVNVHLLKFGEECKT